MAQWILKDTMKITASHPICSLTENEHCDLNLIREQENFMKKCRLYHGNKMKLGNKRMPKIETVLDDDDTVAHTYFQDEPADKTTMPEQDVVDDDGKPINGLDHIVDLYIYKEVKLPHEDKELYGSIVGLCLDKNGRIIGNPDPNSYLNTVLYQIKFDDRTMAAYGGNIVAENMWRMCNNEGYQEDVLHWVIDIRFCKNAVKDGYICNSSGKRVLRKTTKGVDLLCGIKSGQNEYGSD